MAFASEVRTEILENLTLRKKFRRAQGCGLLRCSKDFDAGEISMSTERQEIAQLYRATLRDILGKGCEEIPITRTGMGNATRHYAVALSHPASRQKVLEYFGQQGDQINAEMIAREGEAAAFLSGAYLACGSVTDPEKNYLLEFTVYRAGLVEPLAALLDEKGDEIFRDADSIALEIDMDKEIVKRVFAFAEKYHKPVFAVVSNMHF